MNGRLNNNDCIDIKLKSQPRVVYKSGSQSVSYTDKETLFVFETMQYELNISKFNERFFYSHHPVTPAGRYNKWIEMLKYIVVFILCVLWTGICVLVTEDY